MAKYTPLAFEINLRDDGFIFDVGSLFELFASLPFQKLDRLAANEGQRDGPVAALGDILCPYTSNPLFFRH